MNEPATIGAPAGDNANPDQGGQQSVAGDNGQGDLPEREWVQDLPEPLKASKTLRKFTDSDWKPGLAKAYVELEGKLGKSVQVPDANAKPAEWEKFFSRVGRPEKPDEYETSDGKLDPGFETAFKDRAFKAGLTKAQYREQRDVILKANADAIAAYRAAQEAEAAKCTETLKKEYGKDYDAMLAQAEVAMGALFAPEVKEKLIASGLTSDPAFMKVMVAYGENFGETQFVKGTPLRSAAKKDPYDWMKERFPATR